MYKKVLSCLFLGVFLIYAFNPLKIKAFSNNYENALITDSQYEELVKGGVIAGILQQGQEIVIPDGNSISDLFSDILDFATHSYIGDLIWDYCTQPDGLRQDAQNIKYLIKGHDNESLLRDFVELGFEFSDYWSNNNSETTPEIEPDYSFVNDSTDFVLVSNNSSGSTTWIADNHGWSYRYDQSDYPYSMNKSSYTYVAYPNNTGNFFSGVNGFYLYDITTFYVTFDSINNKYIVTASGYTPKGFKPPNRNGAYTNWFGFYFDNGRLYANNFATNTRTLRYPLEFNTLNDALVDICKYYRHFNLYVDNQPWILVDHTNPIQIGGNTYITNTNTPVNYDIPEFTWFDPAYLIHLLESIDWNTKHSLTWEDIEDAFTDEYGNTALWTIKVVRTDYDNLVLEQYPKATIPDKYHGLELPKDQIQPYFEEMAYITKDAGSDLIPSDILIVLASGGVILLIAFLINRMLE